MSDVQPLTKLYLAAWPEITVTIGDYVCLPNGYKSKCYKVEKIDQDKGLCWGRLRV